MIEQQYTLLAASFAEESNVIRWETPTRYYLATAQQDLFGSWELFRAWGAKGSRLGNQMRQAARDRLHAEELLGSLTATREKRGYRLVGAPNARCGSFNSRST